MRIFSLGQEHFRGGSRLPRGLGMVLVGMVFLMGCASFQSYNPATGKKEFIFISSEEEAGMGRSMHPKIIREYPVSTDALKVNFIRNLGQRVAQVSDRHDYTYNFFLLESKELNAFTTPGGSIYMFTGLLDKLKNGDEIAAVLAHEIGHCAAKHIVKKYQAALGYNIFQSLLLSSLTKNPQVREVASLSSNMTMQLVFSAFSRNDEYEADRLGIKYLDLAGYRMDAMIDILNMLQRESAGSQPILYLRTHPYIKDRIIAANREISARKLLENNSSESSQK